MKDMPMSTENKKWRAEDDLRTLARASEIRKDKQRYKAATDLARAQLAAVSAANKK